MNEENQNEIKDALHKLTEEVKALRSEITYQETRLKNLEAKPSGGFSMDPSKFESQAGEPPEPLAPGSIPTGDTSLPPLVDNLEEDKGPLGNIPGIKISDGMDLESMMGGNILVKVGVLAIVVGMGFFIKYAFDSGIIGETGQIAIGLFSGMVLIGAGEFWKTTYAKYAQTITGGGIAILYLSIYGAYSFYDPPVIDSVFVTFMLMALVTAFAGILSVRYNARLIAIIGLLAGYATPLMLYKDLGSEATLLISYIVLLNFGVMGISLFKNWRPFSLVSLLGSHLLFFAWYSSAYEPEKLSFALFALTVFFLQFVTISVMYHLVNKKTTNDPDTLLLGANAAIYFGWVYTLLKTDYEQWLGFYAIALSMFYFVAGYVAYMRNREDARLTLTLTGVSVVFLTLAVPLQLSQHWITIAWLVEGVVLSWLGFYLKSHYIRAFSLMVFMLALVRLFGFDMYWDVKAADFVPIFNKTFFVYLIGIVSFYLTTYIWWTGRDKTRPEEAPIPAVLFLVANFLTLWIVSNEILRYFDASIAKARVTAEATIYGKETLDYSNIRNLKFLQNLFVSLFWGAYALGLLLVGATKRSKLVQGAGLALVGIVMLKFALVDTLGQTRLTFIQNFSYIARARLYNPSASV